MKKQSKYIYDEYGDKELTIKERMKKMNNKNKPVRISDEVKQQLKQIKQEKELKSIDAVLKKLLKKEGMR